MTLVELLIVTTILILMVSGVTSSTLLFAKISKQHESTSDFRNDIRIGFEQLAFDVRNASRIESRSDTAFTLSYSSEPNIRYWYEVKTNTVYRQSVGGTQEIVMSSISNFDVLTNTEDIERNALLDYNSDEISIEELTFKTTNSRSKDTELTLNNVIFRMRRAS